MRFEGEDAKPIEILEEGSMLQLNVADRFQRQVLERLNKKMKQVDIALELGISTKRVSKIKKRLEENDWLKFSYTKGKFKMTDEQFDFIKSLNSFVVEETSLLLVDRDKRESADLAYIAKKLDLSPEVVEKKINELTEINAMAAIEGKDKKLYILNPEIVGRKKGEFPNLRFA